MYGGRRRAETETRDRHFHARQPPQEEEQVKRKRRSVARKEAPLRPEQVVRKWCEGGIDLGTGITVLSATVMPAESSLVVQKRFWSFYYERD